MIDITRPSKAPESLFSGSYSGIDVVYALHEAFLGKCYLCETPVEPGTLDIDHLKPKAKGQFPELECEWTNLFPTCNTHRCNLRREKKYPEGGLLDPGANHCVEQRLQQTIVDLVSGVLQQDVRCRFSAVDEKDQAAVNSAVELDRVHQGTGSSERAKLSAAALRKAIAKRIMHVATSVRQLLSLPADANDRRSELETELRIHFSRRAPYTMLVRGYFGHRQELRALFEEQSPLA